MQFGRYDNLDYEAGLYQGEYAEGPFKPLLRGAPEIEAGLIPGWTGVRLACSYGPLNQGDSTNQRLTAST